MTPEPPDSLEAPPLGLVVQGKYELVRFLGFGGMGAVYEARSKDDKIFALKLLYALQKGSIAEEIQARFRCPAGI